MHGYVSLFVLRAPYINYVYYFKNLLFYYFAKSITLNSWVSICLFILDFFYFVHFCD